MVPGAAPNHGAAGDDGQAAGDEEDDADVGDAGGEVACQEDEDEADGAEGELEEDGVEGGVAVEEENAFISPVSEEGEERTEQCSWPYPKVDTIRGPNPLTAPLIVYLRKILACCQPQGLCFCGFTLQPS